MNQAGDLLPEGGSLVGKTCWSVTRAGSDEAEGMLESGKGNAYTIEKGGKKKLIYQSPWYREGVYSGFVELSLEIPETMANFVRKG